MMDGLLDYLGTTLTHRKHDRRSPLHRGPIVPYLELSVERALEGARRCRRCAAMQGRYVCIPSAAVRNEWRYSDSGVELIVNVLTCPPDGGPRLQAMLVVEKGSQLHARAVYSGELSSANLEDGPWVLNLISEKSECDFVFPGQVEIAAGGRLAAPKDDLASAHARSRHGAS